jgi:tRNA nucleotidyltransferase (CCA-adding enzyme)
VVGGAVRDALLGRTRAIIDLDLIVPVDSVKLAQEISRDYRSGFVMLDAERSIARLVFDGITVDFAQQMGGSLEADLRRRDYRMNAIADHLREDRLIDPLDGAADLRNKLVRMVSAQNLADDPLRLLRGYRQAAQLGFTIDPETDRQIQALAPRLQQVAAERVMTELRYLLAVSHQNAELLAKSAELLKILLPGIQRNNLDADLSAITTALNSIQQLFPLLWRDLNLPLRPTLPTTGADIALFCGLLGEVRNEVSNKELLTNLTASISEITAIDVVRQCRILRWPATAVDIYNLFQKSGKFFPILAVLKMADGLSAEDLSPLADRYLDPQDPLSHPVVLVNGTELMSALDLPPSPVIGQLLAIIQLAQVQGLIVTKQEAISYAQSKVAECK